MDRRIAIAGLDQLANPIDSLGLGSVKCYQLLLLGLNWRNNLNCPVWISSEHIRYLTTLL